MRNLIWTAALASALATGASAADLAPREAARIAPAFTWTGFYGGLNAGYAWSDTSALTSVPAGSNISGSAAAIAGAAGAYSVNSNGFTGGAQLGYNLQFGPSFVGLEGDFNYVDMSSSGTSGVVTNGGATGFVRDSLSSRWLATARFRTGFVFDRILVYATGGVAFTDAKYNRALDWSFADGCPLGATGLNECHVGGGKWKTGYTVGAGVEYAFAGNWSAKAEYLYADFGQRNFRTINANAATQPLDHFVQFNEQLVRLGVNYRFY